MVTLMRWCPGDVMNEKALVQHTMTNLSKANTRIMAVILLPKGKDVTTVIDTAANIPGPTVAYQGTYPLPGVAAGEYDLVNLVLDFAPGAEIPLHYHGGPALIVGKDGVLTLRPEGGMEHTVSAGMAMNEKAGARHVMINTGSVDAGIFAAVLLPKGAEVTTLVNPEILRTLRWECPAPDRAPRSTGYCSPQYQGSWCWLSEPQCDYLMWQGKRSLGPKPGRKRLCSG